MPSALSVPRLAVGQKLLEQLRLVLDRELPERSAELLREIGFSAGQAAYEGFVETVGARYGVETPQGLDARFLSDALAGFFREDGWGTLTAESLAPGVLALDSPDWAEAEPREAEYPSCHLSSGLLSDFCTRLGGRPAAVMEVECRSRGDAQCRFLVGSPDLLTWLYEGLSGGATSAELLGRLRT